MVKLKAKAVGRPKSHAQAEPNATIDPTDHAETLAGTEAKEDHHAHITQVTDHRTPVDKAHPDRQDRKVLHPRGKEVKNNVIT